MIPSAIDAHCKEYLRAISALERYLRDPKHRKSVAQVPNHPFAFCGWIFELLALSKEEFKLAICKNGNELRRFHNVFGWCTLEPSKAYWDAASSGRAMVFRSAGYMTVSDRDGYLQGGRERTVHCEHTFPVGELRDLIWDSHQTTPFVSRKSIFEFLVSHSICTALSRQEESLIRRAKSNINRPFARYPGEIEVYNMATGQKVSSDSTRINLYKEALCAHVYRWDFIEESWNYSS